MNLFGFFLPKNKLVFVGLTAIFGLGKKSSKKICSKLGLNPLLLILNLSEFQIQIITNELINLNFKIGSDLIRENNKSLKNLIENGSYRGFRHKNNLPVRGQRTRTNHKTQSFLSKKRLIKL